MGTWSKIILSGSSDGEGIKVTGTAPSLGTVIHTAVTHTSAETSLDEVWLFAAAPTAVQINISIGVTTATGSRIKYNIGTANDGLHQIYPGLPLRNAKVIRAYATSDNEVQIFGYVNRFAS